MLGLARARGRRGGSALCARQGGAGEAGLGILGAPARAPQPGLALDAGSARGRGA